MANSPLTAVLSDIQNEQPSNTKFSVNLSKNGKKIVLTTSCTISLAHKAVAVARVGDIVVGISVVNPSENGFTTEEKVITFDIAIDYEQLSQLGPRLLDLTMFNSEIISLASASCEHIVEQVRFDRQLKILNIGQLFPSLGYFGGGKSEPLVVDVNRKVEAIRLAINARHTYLNLSGINLLDKLGSPIPVNKSISVQVSSNNTSRDPITILENKNFHSSYESFPWLEVKFAKKTFVSQVVIANRKDVWGIRSKHLQVSAIKEGKSKLVYDRADNITSLTNKVMEIISTSSFKSSTTDAEEFRDELLETLISSCRKSIGYLENLSLSFLYQLLPTWKDNLAKHHITHAELELLAMIIFIETRESLKYRLNGFARLLNTTENIIHFEECLNHYRAMSQLYPVKITKHGIAPQGRLVADADEVMNVLVEIMDMLEEWGLKPCLGYGTLLGAVRDGTFISHDDDVDILVELTDEPITKIQARYLRDQLVDKLDTNKYRVDYGRVENLNIHIYDKAKNIMIDVFPYWYADEKAQLYMEKMNVRGIDTDIFAGRSTVELHGQALPTPLQPVQFLIERYGSTWNVSDRFHEWPWPLKMPSPNND